MATFLQSLHFDQLLDSVHDEEEAVLVIVPNISRPHPPVFIEGCLVGLLVVHVAEHDAVSPHNDLPDLPRSQRGVRESVPDLPVGGDDDIKFCVPSPGDGGSGRVCYRSRA